MSIVRFLVIAVGVFGSAVCFGAPGQFPRYWWSVVETDSHCEFQATVYGAKGLDPLLRVAFGERELVVPLVPATPARPMGRQFKSADSQLPLPLGYPTFDVELGGARSAAHGQVGTIEMSLSGRKARCELVH